MNLKIPRSLTQAQIGVVSLMLVAFFLTAGYFGYSHYQPAYVYTVAVDGQEVGIVRHQDDLANILKHLTQQEKKRTGYEVAIVQQVTTTRGFQMAPEVHLPNLQFAISQLATYEASGTMILVEGKSAVIVENEESAYQIIEEILAYYTQQAGEGKLGQAKVLTELAMENVSVDPKDILDYESAKSLLLRGTTRYETYQVSRGDSLSVIARMANMSVEELKSANGLDSDSIQIGQELTLTAADPLVEVEVVKEVSTIETIPYTTQWTNTSSLFTGQTRVVTPGQNGQREIKYSVTLVNGKEIERVQISDTVIKEPVTRVAQRGTANMPNRGTGQFRWPIQNGVGRITSHFGNRRSPFTGRPQFHTGIDIAAGSGTPIYAADSGRVVLASYSGGYGNLIIIDHGNGYATFYAHLQSGSMRVRVGDAVSKGQHIAGMGATGQATGVHLHYEIRSNYRGNLSGNPLNPMNFYAP